VYEAFDLTEDGIVNNADMVAMLELTNAIPGDANLDGQVGFDDFLRLSERFGHAGGWENGDFDGNGKIAFRDFTALSARFGKMESGQVTSVPEPRTNIVYFLGFFGELNGSA
jgi:Ca2+-binding EF-hand superfamily protein